MAGKIKVAIAGIAGRFGRASAKAIMADPELELVGGFGRTGASYVEKDIAHLIHSEITGILISNTFMDLLDENPPDVILDFTKAEAVFDTARKAIEHGVRPVIGTSGVSLDDVALLRALANEKQVGAMVVPNFSVGAVLMMEFAKLAAPYYSFAEVVEMHNSGKADAPSGTAMHTANKLSESGRKFNQVEMKETELLTGARGGKHDSGIRVHSIRLPGLISHQEIIFGAEGELLTIRHDGLNTDSYMKGILLAVKAVKDLDHLEVGLETILEKPALVAQK